MFLAYRMDRLDSNTLKSVVTKRWIEGPVDGTQNGWFGLPDLDQLGRSSLTVC